MRRTNPGGGGPKGSTSVLGRHQTGGSNLDILEGAEAWDASSCGSGWVTVVSCAGPGLDFAFRF